jgi:hypothetical protein
MQIRVAGVSVTYKRFVMTSAGTKRTRETAMTIVLPSDMTAIEEGVLLSLVDACIHIAQRMSIGIDEAVARSDIAGRAYSDQA